MEQSTIVPREQKILKARYENIMLAKYFLCLLFPLLNGIFCLVLGGGISFFDNHRLSGELHDVEIVWNWKSILYCISILPIGFGVVCLTHRIQEKLSGMCHKNQLYLTWFDRISLTVNLLLVLPAIAIGYGVSEGGLSNLSMDTTP